MPETGTSILSYRGDPNLGLGANADIPAINPNANLNVINDIGRTAMLLNHENNIRLYQQKVKDRDDLYGLIDAGEIDTRNLNALEEDRPFLKKEREAAKKLFFDMIGNGGLNNPEAVIAYRDKIKEYKDAATQANARYIGIKGLESEKAKEVLKGHQESYSKHIDNQLKKGFWGLVDPYQKSLDFDHEKMNALSLKNALITSGQIGTPETQQTSTTQWSSVTTKMDKDGNLIPTTKVTVKEAPIKTQVSKSVKGVMPLSGVAVSPNGELSEFSQTPEKHIDYGIILANTTDAYLHDEEQQQYQTMWKDYFENGDLFSAQKAINHANEKINQYNNELALLPENKGYVKPFVVGQDIIVDPQSGKIKVNLPTPEFQAKMALASIDGNYVEKSQSVFNEKIADYKSDLRKQAEIERHNKATEGVDWAKYNLDKNKFIETTKGGEESKNAALAFAQGLFGDLLSKASRKAPDGTAVLTPDDIRKLGADQLKFLGKELPSERDPVLGTITKSGGLQPLELAENEVLQVSPDGTVLVMKDATFDEKRQVYKGKWDNSRSTSVFNAARNVLNEENVKSGTKERNAYQPIDMRGRNGNIQIDVSGGSKTTSSSNTNKQVINGYEIPQGATVVYSKKTGKALGYTLNGKNYQF